MSRADSRGSHGSLCCFGFWGLSVLLVLRGALGVGIGACSGVVELWILRGFRLFWLERFDAEFVLKLELSGTLCPNSKR